VTAPRPSQRRAAELRHARESLHLEWAYWRGEACRPVLEKHQSQVDSIVRQLGASLAELDRDPSQVSELVLDLHHVWDFFRTKLALRYVQPVRPFLDAADELAWAAYLPAVLAAGSRTTLREPPLVFLDRGAMPFVSARGSSYRDLLPRDVRTGAGARAASRLPFPVIGVPWYLSNHLPGALLVAHEVGHAIEDDCGLTGEMSARLRGAGLPSTRLAEWERWLGEVFADVVATVTCGAAYVAILLDAIATGSADGAGTQRYPPPPVRAQVCLAAAAHVRPPGQARQEWPLVPRPAAGSLPEVAPPGGTEQTEDEASAVVHALTTGAYEGLGGRGLRDTLAHPDVARADIGADRLLHGLDSALSDARAVLAAAALAFVRDPSGYDHMAVQTRVIAEVLALRPKGPRAVKADPAARQTRDTHAGLALLGLLADGVRVR
jgi:hypothetical protein